MSRIAPVVFAMFFVVLFFGVAHSQQDIEPPQLLDVQFEPRVIDTSKGSQIVTVTIHATDDLSGFAGAFLEFRKPGTTQRAYVEFRPDTPMSELIEGDLLDGRHVTTMTLPQYAAQGEWEMYYVMVVDAVGNRTDTWKPETEEEARNSNWPVLFNGFGFEVENLSAPQQQPRLFLPLLGL